MEKIKSEKAHRVLLDAGLNVSIEQTRAILEFLNNLANIAISVYLLSDNEYPEHSVNVKS